MAGRTRSLLALGAASLALALAGCGGDGEETTGTTAAPGGAAPGQADGGKAQGADRGGSGTATDDGAPRKGDGGATKGGGASGGGGGAGSGTGGSSSAPRNTTHKGTFSPQSRPFRVPGGDNSIQTFGGEAAAAEREAVTATLRAYLEAREAGEWARACREMSGEMIKSLEQLVEKAPRFEGKGCAEIIGALSAGSSPRMRANPMAGDVASLRVERERGFALFKGKDGKGYFMPLARDGDEWKIASLAPVPF